MEQHNRLLTMGVILLLRAPRDRPLGARSATWPTRKSANRAAGSGGTTCGRTSATASGCCARLRASPSVDYRRRFVAAGLTVHKELIPRLSPSTVETDNRDECGTSS
jgi:hypothetical protein